MDGLTLIYRGIAHPEGKNKESLSEFRRSALSNCPREDPGSGARWLLSPGTAALALCLADGDILLYRKRAGAVMGLIMDRLNQIDMGISLCHLMLASEKQGMPFTFDSRADLPKRADCVPVGKLKG